MHWLTNIVWEKTGCRTIQCKEHENSKVGKKMNVGLHVKQIAQVMKFYCTWVK